MSNLRRHPRFRVGAFQLSGQMTFASEVAVIDIGVGGISLSADRRLNIGGKYLLKLEGGGQVVTVTCEVAWSKLSGTRRNLEGESVPVYTAGMKFVGLSPEKISRVLSFVEAIGQHQALGENRRAHPRFLPPPPDLAILDLPADYSVRTISLSGMLIETNQPVEPESRVPMVLALSDGTEIRLKGRVVSCRPPEIGVALGYRVGIEFVEPTAAAREALSSFIAGLEAGAGTEGGPSDRKIVRR